MKRPLARGECSFIPHEKSAEKLIYYIGGPADLMKQATYEVDSEIIWNTTIFRDKDSTKESIGVRHFYDIKEIGHNLYIALHRSTIPEEFCK